MVAGVPVEALRRAPLFADLGRRELGRIAGGMSRRTFAAGTTIAREGEVGVGFFVVDEGRAKVSAGGRQIGELGPGDHFGEVALILETPRTATVTAETELRCYAMTSWEFRRLAETNVAITWKVLESLARRLVRRGELDASV